MSGCINCGAPTPNRRCRDCELADRFEADDPETFDTDASPDDDLRTDGGSDMATDERRPDGDEDAAALIEDVAALVNADRDTHGDAVAQQEAAAQAWTWYLGIHEKLQAGTKITGADVARLMTLLKISRGGIGAYDIDHDRDGVGYMGIAGACAVQEGDADRRNLTRGPTEDQR